MAHYPRAVRQACVALLRDAKGCWAEFTRRLGIKGPAESTVRGWAQRDSGGSQVKPIGRPHLVDPSTMALTMKELEEEQDLDPKALLDRLRERPDLTEATKDRLTETHWWGMVVCMLTCGGMVIVCACACYIPPHPPTPQLLL